MVLSQEEKHATRSYQPGKPTTRYLKARVWIANKDFSLKIPIEELDIYTVKGNYFIVHVTIKTLQRPWHFNAPERS